MIDAYRLRGRKVDKHTYDKCIMFDTSLYLLSAIIGGSLTFKIGLGNWRWG